MTRHPALEPFSRDHNDGLILARKALKLAEAEPRQRIAARGELDEAWERDLQSHFDSEELLLSEIATPEERARLHSEHREIEAHFGAVREGDSSAERFKALGQALAGHIRWEERELFVAIEARGTEEQFARLAQATEEHERSRWEHDPRRRRLVERRLRR